MRPVIVTALGDRSSPELAWAEASRRARRVAAHLVAVRHQRAGSCGSATALVSRVREEFLLRADELLGQARLDLIVARGELDAEIARAAFMDRAELIVADESLWPRDELVDRIAYVVAHSVCPVLVVRAGTPSGIVVGAVDVDGPVRHVVAAVAEETAARPRGFAFLVHCRTAGASNRDGDAHAQLRALARSARFRGSTMVRDDVPGPGLAAVAREVHAELLVLGARAEPGARLGRLGAIGRRLLAERVCSVLIVPPARGGPGAPRRLRAPS